MDPKELQLPFGEQAQVQEPPGKYGNRNDLDVGQLVLKDVFAKAEPRPLDDGSQSAKKNYAERLSRLLATSFAVRLRADFPGVIPDEDGCRQESLARTGKGFKKLDVNYSTPELGLGLGVSVKTLNFRDGASQRYTKNYTRIDNELRAEAKDYHERQPYAVLVAVVFLPWDACEDARLKGRGEENGVSSFGQAIRVFRFRAGRTSPRDEHELFERVFVGLYRHAGARAGQVGFFDVRRPPPKQGPPSQLLAFDQLIADIRKTYDNRNAVEFEWAK